MSESTLKHLVLYKKKCDDAYYNTGNPLIGDGEYDKLVERIRKLDPNHPCLTQTGIKPKKTPVNLPYPMPSLRKVFSGRHDVVGEVERLFSQSNVIHILPKLDGNSGAVLSNEDGRFLYQRGDGIVGSNVTHYLSSLHTKIGELPKGIMIRGECIMQKQTFAEKYSKGFVNARNLVSGIMNADFDQKIQDVDFIAYDVIHLSDSVVEDFLVPSGDREHGDILYFSDAISALLFNNVCCAPVMSLYKEGDGYRLVENFTNYSYADLVIDKSTLEKHLCVIYSYFTSRLPYEIDGLVIRTDDLVINQPISDALPKNAFAFKVNKSTQVEVLGVDWRCSMNGRLIPVVSVTPTFISGATISYVLGHNARYVTDNMVNAGAIVELTRSGEVIPYIESVVSPADKPPKPDPSVFGDYTWDGHHYVVSSLSAGILLPQLEYCVSILEFDNWGRSVLSDLVGYGIITKLTDLYSCDVGLLISKGVCGYGDAKIKNLVDARTKALSKVQLPALMAASRKFGTTFGRRRFAMILKSYPDDPLALKDKSVEEIKATLEYIQSDGIGEVYSDVFAKGYAAWVEFYESIKNYITLAPSTTWLRLSGSGKQIVFTLVRDNLFQKQLERAGYVIGDSVNKNTVCVITQDPNAKSKKLDKARSLNIPIYDLETVKEMSWTLEN